LQLLAKKDVVYTSGLNLTTGTLGEPQILQQAALKSFTKILYEY